MIVRPTTETAWKELRTDLQRFIRPRVRDEHTAEDLVQETLLRIYRHIDQLDCEDRLAAWVYRIARNVIQDHYRKQAGPEVGLAKESSLTDEAEDDARCRVGGWLGEMIRQLPEKYAEPVRLSEIDGVMQQDVADRLGLSLSGAKSRIQRGRAMLKEVLEACCEFHFDPRGNLMDCDPKPTRTICRDCHG